MSRSRSLILLVLAFTLAATAAAQARRPIVAYLDANGRFAMVDTQTGQPVTSPIPADDVKSFGVSQDGRYFVYFDKAGKLHLYDAVAKAPVALPGTENSSGGYPTVSDTGLIAWDANANGPTTVYDSVTKQFVDVGLAADPTKPNNQRMPEFSGDGRFLATNCLDSCIGTPDDNDGTATYVQDVAAKKDTGFPVNLTKGDEHTCINGDGSVVGMDVMMAGSMKHGIYLYDRATGQAIDVSQINDPNLDQRYCVLDSTAQYVGLSADDGTTTTFRLYDLHAQSFVTLPVAIPGTVQGSIALIQPPPPAPAPAPAGAGAGEPQATSVTSVAPKLSALRATVRGRRVTLRFTLSTAATVKVRLGRVVRNRFRALHTLVVHGHAGVNAVRITGPRTRGAYALRVTANGTTRSLALRIR